MSDFGYFPAVTRFGEDDATGFKTQVTSSASANTKGAWVQVSASCPFDTQGVIFSLQSETSLASTAFLVDIGVGAAGSEVVAVPNMFSPPPYSQYAESFFTYLPVGIPAGTRVSVRCANSTGSSAMDVKLQFVAANGAMPHYSATAYGADTANSRGTAITCGAAANVFGTYALITASTTAPMRQALLCFGNGSPSEREIALTLAIGPSGQEVDIINRLFLTALMGNIPSAIPPAIIALSINNILLPLCIPAGTRITAKTKESGGGSLTTYFSMIGFN